MSEVDTVIPKKIPHFDKEGFILGVQEWFNTKNKNYFKCYINRVKKKLI